MTISRNKLIHKKKSSSSLERTVNQFITGFTIEQDINFERYKDKNNALLKCDKKKWCKTKSIYHLIKDTIANAHSYISCIFKKKEYSPNEVSNKSNVFKELEEAVSIKSANAGSSRYVGYLDKLRFNE